MNLPKNLINLLGLVVVLGVVVAGLVLVALPMWGGAQKTQASAASVAQTNAVYDAQLQALRAASERTEEIDASLDELGAEISAIPQMDDVFEIVAEAASSTGVVIVSIKAGDLEAWVPRAPVTEFSDPANPGQSTDDTAAESSTDSSAAPASGADGSSGAAESSTETTDPSAGVEGDTPQQQVTVTIEVTAPTAAAAAAFIDALGLGPRLIAPVDATLDPAVDEGNLVVNALAFIWAEA